MEMNVEKNIQSNKNLKATNPRTDYSSSNINGE